MIVFRHFRNADPPSLAALWNIQPSVPGRVRPISSQTLERFVLAKPHFNPHGAWLALRDGNVCGFLHAARGAPTDLERGSISLLIVAPDENDSAVPEELIARGVDFLWSQGVKHVQAGCLDPVDPFYFGLYNVGAPGLGHADSHQIQWFLDSGFEPTGSIAILQNELLSIRAPVDREQMQLKRSYDVRIEYDWPSQSTWEAVTSGAHERIRFQAFLKGTDRAAAQFILVDMNAISGRFGSRQYFVQSIHMDPKSAPIGLMSFLIAESIRQLQAYGISNIYTHSTTPEEGEIWLRMGFVPCGESQLLSRPLLSTTTPG